MAIKHGTEGGWLKVRYTVKDIPALRDKYFPGTLVDIVDKKVDGDEMARSKRRTLVIVATHPHHVELRNEIGRSECFGYVEMEKLMAGVML